MKRLKQDSSTSKVSQGQGPNQEPANKCLDLTLPKPEEESASATHSENSSAMEVEGEKGEMSRSDSDKEASKEMTDLLERIVRGYHELTPRIMSLSDDEARAILKEGYVSLL